MCSVSFIEAHLPELKYEKVHLKLMYYYIHETCQSPSKMESTVIIGNEVHKGTDMTKLYYKDGMGCLC